MINALLKDHSIRPLMKVRRLALKLAQEIRVQEAMFWETQIAENKGASQYLQESQLVDKVTGIPPVKASYVGL